MADDIAGQLRMGIARENHHSTFIHGEFFPTVGLLWESGWAARIRTWECRIQNPVPYRLATAQKTVALQVKRTRRVPAPSARAAASDSALERRIRSSWVVTGPRSA